MALIELERVTRSYAVGDGTLQVLKGIDLTIEEGEFVAIMGPSGSGKSTLMQILGLLDRPTSGKYRLLGRDVSRLTDDEGAALRSVTIGFIFQMFNLLARTTTLDNVMLPLNYAGRREAGGAAWARKLLDDVGLGDRLGHAPNQLSGGQQQRVAIARALVNRPRIIFADEPTGNLASDQATDILRRLQEMNRSGITVIMVTHEPDIAAYSKRIIRIKDGLIVSDEPNEPARAGLGSSGGGIATATLAARKASPKAAVKIEPPQMGASEIRENVRSAWRAMAANKVRSGLSMLGILIGVMAVIAMLAIGRGAQKSIEDRLSSLGSNLLMMFPWSSTAMYHGSGGSASRLTLEDVKAVSRLPHIVAVDGNVDGNVQAVFRDKNETTSLTGASFRYETMRASKPYYGRFFTQREDDSLARVVLLGQTVVTNLFGQEDPTGQVVKLNHESYRVIGILPAKGSSTWRDQDDAVLVPLNTAMKRLLGKKYLDMIAIECDSPDNIPGVMSAVQGLMRRRHHLPEYKDDDFTIRNMADIQQALAGTSQTFSLLLGIVAAISLLVGGIGIMNIMLVSVSERTREIGLRKAVGAARRAILLQFLIEASVLSTFGGLIGIVLGVAISLGLSRFAGWAAIVSPQSIVLAFAFSAGVGILFGFWPARKASLLSPIEALRYE